MKPPSSSSSSPSFLFNDGGREAVDVDRRRRCFCCCSFFDNDDDDVLRFFFFSDKLYLDSFLFKDSAVVDSRRISCRSSTNACANRSLISGSCRCISETLLLCRSLEPSLSLSDDDDLAAVAVVAAGISITLWGFDFETARVV